jgi:predicted ArsR family transcriptional regulator
MDNTDERQLQGVAALAEPVRRALYEFVVGRQEAVGREEAASATGVSRSVAAFHLDRLVRLGLLDTESRRLSGRQGPGAGRPSKLYRRARREFAVSVPPRQYDLAADLLAEAAQQSAETGEPVAGALTHAAATRGQALGESVRSGLRSRAGRRATLEAVADELRRQGYEPRVEPGEISLANCPFHSLAERHRDLVCGMNLDLLGGLAAALPEVPLSARIDPVPDGCCVRIRVEP